MSRYRNWFILLTLFICANPIRSLAQDTTLSGIVTDTTDAVLPGVTVTALHVDSGNTFVGVSDAEGRFRVGPLRTGRYTITVELQGFATVRRESVEFLLGQQMAMNFKLPLSSVQESVTVTGESPLINVSQSKMGSNIDTRQMQELPLNGRNWMELTMLASGSRANDVGESPYGTHAGQFQLNLDGQQVSNNIACARFGQPKFSRDSIAEFEYVTSRFDATQGRSLGVQVNAITRGGTNRYTGIASGYFRNDTFNAKDFIVNRVLDYSNQQFSMTFGGPILKDRAHFFVNYEGEREPQTYTFTSAFPRFNIADLTGVKKEHKAGIRTDFQINQNTRLMARVNGWDFFQPYTPASAGGSTGGALLHPSRASSKGVQTGQAFTSLTQTFGSKVNDLKIGVATVYSDDQSLVRSPQISLAGYTIGQENFKPLIMYQRSYTFRDDFTWVKGRNEMKVGGDYIYYDTYVYWPASAFGVYDMLGGAIPPNVQDLFPVWNDASTWNLGALSPITRRFSQGITNEKNFTTPNIQNTMGTWIQDNFKLTPSLTLNLGLRYDVSLRSLAEHLELLPLRTKQPHDLNNWSPRLGFAYSINDRTVARGGYGIYYEGLTTQTTNHTQIDLVAIAIDKLNDGRPDFAANPWNGPTPTFEQALALSRTQVRNTVGLPAAPNVKTPYSHQGSIGMQRQLTNDMSFNADFVVQNIRDERNWRNANLAYNPETGANYPFSDISRRPYQGWGNVTMMFTDLDIDYRGLETSFTKRMSHNWQLSATYTLSGTWSRDPLPILAGCQYPASGPGPKCDVPVTVPRDLGGERSYHTGDQRHRAVVNGIWQLPYKLQLSGLYFYGSGVRFGQSSGLDLRGTGGAGRLRRDGSIAPRNGFVGTPLHRVDMRVQRRVKVGHMDVDGMFEVFNLFNRANYGTFVTSEASPLFGRPVQNSNLAYAPRMVQLGFRLGF